MKWSADAALEPGRDGLNVFNLRAYTAPLHDHPRPVVRVRVRVRAKRRGPALERVDGAGRLRIQPSRPGSRRSPTATHSSRATTRTTAGNEAFDPLFPGFYDWGYWWQGEIAGEYFLSNSNLKSHLVRAHVAPTDAVSGGLIFYRFSLDQPRAVAAGVSDKDVALEVDAYVDWKVNANFTVSVVGAFADPGKAVQQTTGRTKNFAYGMVYVAYSF